MTIETKNLIKHFRNEAAISYDDLTFEDGKTCVLLGASGCGKSTLLNMIAGILSPSEGQVLIEGRDMTSLSQREKDLFRVRQIGYIFQDFKLLEEMRVEDNIRLLEMENVDTSHLRDTLDRLGIGALRRRRVKSLSGGEKQRVAIARALIKRPSIILADEPTGNLNYAIGADVMDLLIGASRGNTLIAVTHDDRLAEKFDRVIDMNSVAHSGEARKDA